MPIAPVHVSGVGPEWQRANELIRSGNVNAAQQIIDAQLQRSPSLGGMMSTLQALEQTRVTPPGLQNLRQETQRLAQTQMRDGVNQPLPWVVTAHLALQDRNDQQFRETTRDLVKRFPESEYASYFTGVQQLQDGDYCAAEQSLKQARDRGMPEESIAALLKLAIDGQKWIWEYATIIFYVIVAWMVGLVMLFAVGLLLSSWTVRSLQAGVLDSASPVERWLRQAYRIIINLAGFYYFGSLPVLVLLAVALPLAMGYALLTLPYLNLGLVALVLVLGVGGVVTALSGVRAAFFYVRRREHGQPITDAEAPRLWQVVRAVAKQVGTRCVDEIRILPSADIFVHERGGIRQRLHDRSQRILVLGLGALYGLKLDALRCILAHEYGHFLNRDTAGGDIALRVGVAMNNFAAAINQRGKVRRWDIAVHFLRAYDFLFRRLTFGASRLQEVLADRVAVQCYGRQALVEGLTHVIRRSVDFDVSMSKAVHDTIRATRPALAFFGPTTAPNIDERAQIESTVHALLERPTTADDTHPSPCDRFEQAARFDPEGKPLGEDLAWSLLDDGCRLIKEMDQLVDRAINEEACYLRDMHQAMLAFLTAHLSVKRHPDLFFERARIYLSQGDFAKAIDDLNKVLSFVPDVPEVLYRRALAYKGLGDLGRAIDDLFYIVSQERFPPLASNELFGLFATLGDYLSKSGRLEDAVQAYTKARTQVPNSLIVLVERGRAYGRLGQCQLALADLDKAIELWPGSPEPYLERALIHEATGDRGRADSDRETAQRLDPRLAVSTEPTMPVAGSFASAFVAANPVETIPEALPLADPDLELLPLAEDIADAVPVDVSLAQNTSVVPGAFAGILEAAPALAEEVLPLAEEIPLVEEIPWAEPAEEIPFAKVVADMPPPAIRLCSQADREAPPKIQEATEVPPPAILVCSQAEREAPPNIQEAPAVPAVTLVVPQASEATGKRGLRVVVMAASVALVVGSMAGIWTSWRAPREEAKDSAVAFVEVPPLEENSVRGAMAVAPVKPETVTPLPAQPPAPTKVPAPAPPEPTTVTITDPPANVGANKASVRPDLAAPSRTVPQVPVSPVPRVEPDITPNPLHMKLQTTIEAHSTGVGSLAVSPAGELVATAALPQSSKSWRGEVKVWKLSPPGVLAPVTTLYERGPVDFSPDGNELVFTGGRSSVNLYRWNVQTRTSSPTTMPCWSSRFALKNYTFHPDGKHILVSSRTSVHMHEFSTGKELARFESAPTAANYLVYSPDGTSFAVSLQGYKSIVVDAATGQPRFSRERNHIVQPFAYSPDAKELAIPQVDGRIDICEPTTGDLIVSLRGHRLMAGALAYSPNGKYLVSASLDNTIRIWDRDTRREIIVVTLATPRHIVYHPSLAFSADGKLLLAGFGTEVLVWSFEQPLGPRVASSQPPIFTLPTNAKPVATTAPASTKPQPVVPSAKTPVSPSLQPSEATGLVITPRTTIKGRYAHPPRAVLFLPGDSSRLIMAGFGVSIWDTKTQQQINKYEGHKGAEVQTLTLLDGGKTLCSTDIDRTVRTYDLNFENEENLFGQSRMRVFSLAVSPDSTELALIDDRHFLHLYHRATKERRSYAPPRLDRDTLESVAYAPDGKTLAVGCMNSVRLLETSTLKERQRFTGHKGLVLAVAFSPDGKTLASGGGDLRVKLWDVGSGKERMTLRDPSGAVNVLVFHPREDLLLSAAGGSVRGPVGGGAVTGWDWKSGKIRCTLRGHTSGVCSLTLSSDAKTAATCSRDWTMRVWDLAPALSQPMPAATSP